MRVINTLGGRVCAVHYNVRDPETIWATPDPRALRFGIVLKNKKKNHQDNKYPRP